MDYKHYIVIYFLFVTSIYFTLISLKSLLVIINITPVGKQVCVHTWAALLCSCLYAFCCIDPIHLLVFFIAKDVTICDALPVTAKHEIRSPNEKHGLETDHHDI